MKHRSSAARPFSSVPGVLLAAFLCTAGLHAQNKKPAPAPAKPAAAPAKPAAAPAAHAASGASATHSATATTSATGHTTTGATTAGHTTGVTTANHATTSSPTTAGRATTTTTGRPAAAAGASAAGRPGATPVAAHPGMSPSLPRGAHEVHGPAGDVRMRSPGHPSDVHDARRNMDIHHNLAGGRRIESMHPDGRRFVSERGRPGYIGRPYAYRGHDYERRAYYDHGRLYNRYYGGYHYHGYDMRVYAPGRYYSRAYYGWAYNPWAVPVRYGWGFESRPWYGVYGGYFTPYPVYSTPALWLTDYMISQTLAASYQARLEAGAEAGPANAAYAGPPLSPEAKQMIANEVQNDIALENNEAAQNQSQAVPDSRQSSVARLLEDGKPHAFVAGREVDVVDGTGAECAITDGDVIKVATPPAPQDTTANMIVMASKGGKDCAAGAQVAVQIAELQEMDNHLREQVDAGLQELATQQGKKGLPAAPASALAPPTDALVAQGAPPPEANVAQDLAQQDTQAQQAEKEVLTSTGAPAPAAPPTNSTDDLFKPQ